MTIKELKIVVDRMCNEGYGNGEVSMALAEEWETVYDYTENSGDLILQSY